MSRSGSRCSTATDPEAGESGISVIHLEGDEDFSETVTDSQAEVLYGGLDRGRVKLVSRIRGLGMGEEHRRVVATNTSRRGNKFNHLFPQNDVFIGQKCLDKLCQALVD